MASILKDTLLLEIGTEELPPKQIKKLASTLAMLVDQQLSEQHIEHGKVSIFGAPRRLAFIIEGTANFQDHVLIERKGPSLEAAFKNGTPTPAALGFANSCGVDINALSRLKNDQGEWLLYCAKEEGKPLAQILEAIIINALNKLPIAKPMRWGSLPHSFIRPVHWLVALHGTDILPIKILGTDADRFTWGHRFLSNTALTLTHANDYQKVLRDNFVLADFVERKQMIKQQLEFTAKNLHCTVIIDEELLEEVCGIIDNPTTLSASFNASFLQVPDVALISAMQNHQKCFPLLNENGRLLNKFLFVTNAKTTNYDLIIRGNEKVMSARLSDAKFFFTQDSEHKLEYNLDLLKAVIFEKDLGSMYEKSLRCALLAQNIAQKLFPALTDAAYNAARLAKADLTTHMVKEFPELQGIMGYHYLLQKEEPTEIALAVKESYYPRFAKDLLPTTDLGCCVAVTDKLDTLIGIFGVGKKPTGEKDPFALRRAALGILRILIEKQLDISLEELISLAKTQYKFKLIDDLEQTVLDFILERMRVILQEKFSPQIAEAILKHNVYYPTYRPSLLMQRANALFHFNQTNDATALALINKRIKNILQKNEINLTVINKNTIKTELFTQQEEIDLYHKLQLVADKVTKNITDHNYTAALIATSELQVCLNAFFETVMVMCENEKIRENRLNLLTELYIICTAVADLSCL